MRTSLSPGDIDHLCFLYEQGHRVVDVAEQMHCSPSLVSKTLRARGVVTRPTGAGARHPWRQPEGYLQERGELHLSHME